MTKLLSILSKIFVWGLLFAIIHELRSFALLIFLTFVFSYVQSNIVENLKDKIQNRLARVLSVSIVFWAIIISVFLYITPQFVQQGNEFIKNIPTYLSNIDAEIIKARNENLVLQDMFPSLDSKFTPVAPENNAEEDTIVIAEGGHKFSLKNSPTVNFINIFLGNQGDGAYLASDGIKKAAHTIRIISVTIFSIVGTFLLSLLFSFLIVLDLPRLKKTISDLRNTKIQFIYDEVADSIKDFCNVLGKALEAQFFIAICNTILTFLGLIFLGLSSKAAFLSVIVFVCSFIPIVGVFISSVPICLFSIQTSGLNGMLIAILLITGIHLVETYILNPRIYGSHLKLNPIFVLIILTMCGKLFHTWGLVLGVPIFSYFFYYSIRNKKVEH